MIQKKIRSTSLVVALAALLPVACSAQPSQPIASPSKQVDAPLVTGLPDFTRLVQQVSPGVVSVNAEISASRGASARGADMDQMPEIFRRFFGDQMPPGMIIGPQNRDRAPSTQGVSVGTGFLISQDGYLLTNAHVVRNASKITIRLADRREMTAKVVGADSRSDVALLKVEGSNLPYLKLADSSTVKQGQWVVAIGSPFGLEQSVTAGIVSAVGRNTQFAENQYVPFIQTDVAINRGNSGGPLLNTSGQVVGINSQIFSNSGGYMGVSFAIPIDVAMNAAEQLRSTGRVERGQLGVRVQALSEEQVRALKLPSRTGALVADVEPGSAGAKAGLLPLDVITAVNGVAVTDSAQLPSIIGGMRPGEKVDLTVVRDGQSRKVAATLGALAAASSDASSRDFRDGSSSGPSAAPAAAANKLGVVTQDIPAAVRSRLGLPSGQGVGISRVVGQAAADAGLSSGDVILAIGRDNVASSDQLNKALAKYKKGDSVMVRVQSGRGGGNYVAITLE